MIGVLQQRFDLPREAYEPERRPVTPASQRAEFGAFIANANLVTTYAIQYRDEGTPTIVIVDPIVRKVRERIADDARLEGRWGLLDGDKRNLLRFDGFANGIEFGRWILSNPDESLIRAGAAGAHSVTLISERPSEDQEEAERQWQQGVHLWVPHVEVFRVLLLGLQSCD